MRSREGLFVRQVENIESSGLPVALHELCPCSIKGLGEATAEIDVIFQYKRVGAIARSHELPNRNVRESYGHLLPGHFDTLGFGVPMSG